MDAKSLAIIIAGVGTFLVGAGGTVLLGLAWLLNATELGLLFWALPLVAVGGLALATYGIAQVAAGVFGEADGLRDVATDLDWHRVKHYLD